MILGIMTENLVLKAQGLATFCDRRLYLFIGQSICPFIYSLVAYNRCVDDCSLGTNVQKASAGRSHVFHMNIIFFIFLGPVLLMCVSVCGSHCMTSEWAYLSGG